MHLRVPARNEKVHLSSQELWSGKMRGRVQDLVTESFCNCVASLVIWVVLKMHIECCLAGVLTSFVIFTKFLLIVDLESPALNGK